MFFLSFVKGAKSVEGGPNPLADMDPGGPILGGSKSARTPGRTSVTFISGTGNGAATATAVKWVTLKPFQP